jgi:hypothetical protein
MPVFIDQTDKRSPSLTCHNVLFHWCLLKQSYYLTSVLVKRSLGSQSFVFILLNGSKPRQGLAETKQIKIDIINQLQPDLIIAIKKKM